MAKQYRIAISGKARSGKDLIASMFYKVLTLNEYSAKITAIANPMKQIVEIMFQGLDKYNLYGPSENRSKTICDLYYDLTYRQALLDIGKFGRAYNKDIWLHYLENDLNQSKDKIVYIVSDCRFINEFEFLRKHNFYMIRIIRDNSEKIDDISETEQNEIPNSLFDVVIYNNSSLDDLYTEVVSISNKLKAT
jgi:hypothetical protein